MKVCIVVPAYHTPSETFINRHIAKLFGGNTCVICRSFNGNNPYGKSVLVRSNRYTWPDNVIWPFFCLYSFARDGIWRPLMLNDSKAISSWLTSEAPDLIVAEYGTIAPPLARISNRLEIPIFAYFRGFDASVTLRTRRRVRAYKLAMPKLAGIFAVSQFLLDELARHGVEHPNSHVIPSGVDIGHFVPGPKRSGEFITVGRMVEKKAPDLTLKAFAAGTMGTDAHLTMIGEGPLLDTCQVLAEELGVTHRVTFTGKLSHGEVLEHMKTAEVFLQHSVTARDGNTEGLPSAIQEALACGCIVLSTRHAGIPEGVTHGVNGFLVEEHDLSGFTKLIAEIQRLPFKERMARAARRTAEDKFDSVKILEKTERVLYESQRTKERGLLVH